MDIGFNQFQLVVNVFSFTIAAMGVTAVFMFLQRGEVLPRYRPAVTIVGLVTLVATYNYLRLYNSWDAAYSVVSGLVRPTGAVFNDTYRYADWLLTVPLIVIALVLILDLPARQARVRCAVLGIQAAEMILLGYPGQIASSAQSRWLWWAAAMVPFLIIVQQLYIGMAEAVRAQPERARGLVVLARFVTVLTWCFYPAVYVLPMLGVGGSTAFISSQIGYAAADLLAKVGFGVLIYLIAARKTEIAMESEKPAAAAIVRRAA